MGKLLSLLARDDSNCCSPQKYDVFLDFENAQPTDGEQETFEEVQRVLRNSEPILEEIQCYKGAGKEIREAISTPTEEFQQKAWQAVMPLVSRLKRFYEFSTELEIVVPKILFQLCSGPMTPTQHLETQQALVKQFAEILEFVLKFDEYKDCKGTEQSHVFCVSCRAPLPRMVMLRQQPIRAPVSRKKGLTSRPSSGELKSTRMLVRCPCWKGSLLCSRRIRNSERMDRSMEGMEDDCSQGGFSERAREHSRDPFQHGQRTNMRVDFSSPEEGLEVRLKRSDCSKMKTPAIQNDFSYYRRTITRQRMSSHNGFEHQDTREVTNELANRMSLFYAHATPMLKVLSEATSAFVKENPDIPIENTTETLSTMAKVCLRMLENPNLIAQFQREETQLFVLRVMVGLVILYDHVHPQGAFVKASNVDVKGCVKLLKEQPAARSEGLLNALRYTTKHLNEEATPKNIKNLLAA